jgi:hypothetical protein
MSNKDLDSQHPLITLYDINPDFRIYQSEFNFLRRFSVSINLKDFGSRFFEISSHVKSI